jgi:hypothetical protein
VLQSFKTMMDPNFFICLNGTRADAIDEQGQLVEENIFPSKLHENSKEEPASVYSSIMKPMSHHPEEIPFDEVQIVRELGGILDLTWTLYCGGRSVPL